MEDLKSRAAALEFLKDFPEGPLDQYRKHASFDWKSMALVMEPEPMLRFKVFPYSLLISDSLSIFHTILSPTCSTKFGRLSKVIHCLLILLSSVHWKRKDVP
jgi:hypothetical protein